MATGYFPLYMGTFAVADSSRPGDNITGVSSVDLCDMQTNYKAYLYFTTDSFPSNLKRNRLYNAKAYVYYTESHSASYGMYYDITLYASMPFDSSTLTWSNKPQFFSPRLGTSVYTRTDLSPAELTSSDSGSALARSILQQSAFMLYGGASSSYHGIFSAYTSASGEQTTPYIEIEYDTVEKVAYSLSLNSTDAYINPGNAYTFSWQFVTADLTYHCAADPIQRSATFKWWTSDAPSTIHTVNISTAQMSVGIAANTFPSGKTIYCRVEATDDLGESYTSENKSFSTAAPLLTATPVSPINGYAADETKPIEFSWQVNGNAQNYQTRADLQWSTNQSTWTALASITGNGTRWSSNGGVFPAATIYWRVRAYNVDGTVGNWTSASFSTVDATAYAYPLLPKDSVEDNSADIKFTWSVSISSGSAQTKADLQYSLNGGNYASLGTVTGNAKELTVPGGTIPSGTIAWRVRSYNRNVTAGPWSDPVSFVSFGAPAAPQISVQAGGFAIVTWQADVQEAYRITIDGKLIGPFFGTTKSFQFEDYLPVGQHTVSVEVQNSFGLWSQPGTEIFEVTMSPYAEPSLNRKPGGIRPDVRLIVTNDNALTGTVTGLYLYRDGVKIASLDPSVEKQEFTDRFVLGTHVYRVVARYYDTDVSYIESVEGLEASARVCCPMVALFSGGEWMRLRLSETPSRTESFSKQRQISIRHFSGAEYPLVETSPFADASGSYDVAFYDVDEANAFEALLGKMVILKTKANNVIIGILSGYEKRVNKHFIAYTFSIQQIYWRDYLDLTGN